MSSTAAQSLSHDPYLLVVLASTVGVAVIASLSYLFYRVVELPSHRYGRRLSTRF